MILQNDAKINQWFNLIQASENTKKTYLGYMGRFCECVKKTPTELIDEATIELKQGLLPSERKSMEYISQYRTCLKGLSPNTIALGIRTVKSFYKSFDIQLSASAGRIKKPVVMRENTNFINRDDVVKLIANAKSLRDRSIILCMASSGMARNEIRNLRFNDIVFDEQGIGIINIRREKAQTDFTTFISPEATITLKNYLAERERIEKLNKKGNDDYVFVTYYTGGQLGDDIFTYIFYTLGKELGYGNGKGFVKSRSHALRKFFASTLETAGMQKQKIDYMLGHTQNGNDAAYFKIDSEKLKEQYIKNLPFLTFEKVIEVRSLDTKDAERLEVLEKENAQLKQEHDSENKQLQKQMKDQQEQIDVLMKMVKAGWKPPEL